MADLSITASNLIPTAGYNFRDGTAGASITAGDVCYESATTPGSWLLADNNDTAAKAAAVGIALTTAVSGQPLRLMTGGTLAVGAALTINDAVYCVSSTAGKICPYADLDANDYVTIVGVPLSTSSLRVAIRASGIQIPS